MSPSSYAVLVLALLGAAIVTGACGWITLAGPAWHTRIPAPLSTLFLAAAALVAAVPARLELPGRGGFTLLVVLAGTLAVVGGGPVTSRVFALVDGQAPAGASGTMDGAGQVLRGGAWIGALERAAIFASLAVQMPEGIAIVLGLKGLGRYPELRNQDVTGAAERFIIGTFTSVLWASACAGVVLLLS